MDAVTECVVEMASAAEDFETNTKFLINSHHMALATKGSRVVNLGSTSALHSVLITLILVGAALLLYGFEIDVAVLNFVRWVAWTFCAGYALVMSQISLWFWRSDPARLWE